MKKLILGVLLVASSGLLAQGDFTPTILRNLEMIFDDQFADYTRMTNVDPTVSPVDTYMVADFQKDALGYFLHGREWSDIVYTNWACQTVNGVNEIYMVDAQLGDTAQVERIYRDASGRDTLYEIYVDTSGNGQMALFQEFRLYYGSNGVDSAYAGVPGQGALGTVNYYFFRDANGRADSVLAAVSFAGTSFPVQTVRYYYGSNGLDSLNLFNNMNGNVEEQSRVSTNSNGEITEFRFYERDVNNEWSLYDTYYLSDENFFSITETRGLKTSSISLFPNPSSHMIQIETISNSRYQILDMQGKVLMEGELDAKDEVQLDPLKTGTYILRLESDKGLIGEKRFIKK